MSNPRIIAYCFNSAIVCPACTNYAYDITGELVRPMPPVGDRKPPVYDEHRLPDDMTNVKYEPVRPVFNTDDYPDGLTCDDCGKQIP
jgi:hypothetical protein